MYISMCISDFLKFAIRVYIVSETYEVIEACIYTHELYLRVFVLNYLRVFNF